MYVGFNIGHSVKHCRAYVTHMGERAEPAIFGYPLHGIMA